jgi:hypothetical protein
MRRSDEPPGKAAAHLDILEVRCDRRGRLRLDRLVVEHGLDALVGMVLRALSATARGGMVGSGSGAIPRRPCCGCLPSGYETGHACLLVSF